MEGRMMEKGRPSFTAVISAMMRAAHLLIDGEPKIFSDTLARGFSGAETDAALMASLEHFEAAIAAKVGPERAKATFRYLRAVDTMRSRFTEDELNQAARRGMRQYVILGAGLDSFAYRRGDLSGDLHVFEVDRLPSQQWKRVRLGALNIVEPNNLTFVPIDFEQHLLANALQAGGYRLGEPGFFSWLGTTQYLTEEAIFKTLQEVASLAPGTEIVFQYQVSEHLLDEGNRQLLDVLRRGSSAGGEPWLTLFDPLSLQERVKEMGFVEVVDLGPEQVLPRYFVGRTDSLPTPCLSHLMKARVGRVSQTGS
jgi:methyltransferase (TIGR00027 family)